MSSPDVVVIGGGAIGLACAWRVGQAGLSVTVVDPEPGSGASGVAAGMLAPVTEAHFGEEPLLALNLAAAERWPLFATELVDAAGLGGTGDLGYSEAGTLLVAYDASDHAVLDDLHRYQSGLDLPVTRLTRRQCRELEPMLSPSVRSGLLAEHDRSIDPTAVVTALVVAAERAGVAIRRGSVTDIEVDGGRAVGVRVGDDRIPAGTVVLAAGCWSAGIGGLPPEAVPPVRPVKGQILTLAGPAGQPVLGRSVRGVVQGSSVYLVPRTDGRVVVGATVEEQGWDTEVTAGGVHDLLRDARLLVPGLGELRLVEARAGLRPGSPDNAPIIGAAAIEGLVVATGHFRNGILLAPITADAVAALIATGLVVPEVQSFGPARFAPTAAARR